MGLTKEYYKYDSTEKFNLIANAKCNTEFVLLQNQPGRFLAVGGCEDVFIWDLRLGEKALTLKGEKSECSYICASPNEIHIAVGFQSGVTTIYNLKTQEVVTVFAGHRSPISALAFDVEGHRLATGSRDTEIVTWDVVAECGLERLNGHKGMITDVCFMKMKNILVSSSKDTLIKIWDLDTSHCFHTIAAHVTEIWGLVLVGDDEYLVAGSNDSELRVWAVKDTSDRENLRDTNQTSLGDVECVKVGSILREGRGRVVSLRVDNTGRTICVHGSDNTVELFTFLTSNDARLRWKKRTAKEKKKATKTGSTYIPREVSLKDGVIKQGVIKASAKVKSVAVVQGQTEIRVGVTLANNCIELFKLEVSKDFGNSKVIEKTPVRQLVLPGHQGDVRAVAFSSDGLALASVGTGDIKMWNRTSQRCLRTVKCGYGVSVTFVVGDRHALVGMKEGQLLIVDLVAGEVLEEIPAHSQELWAIAILPDKSGVVTGGGDNTVKEWKFELITEEKSNVLSLSHCRTLKLNDCVLAVRLSPCGTYLAAALLDSTVRLFYFDTFKFFLSLYGHSMPILCTDISYDSKLIITGSSDKNIKIWGLDFGDCHKSLFAHDDAVTSVQFVDKTYYFFSIGKDGKVKQWDGKNFEKILTLPGHFGEGWGLSVCGPHVVTCGQDRCLRLYSKTDEILVLSDEQEEERAEQDQLITGQSSLVTLPSVKTVSAETAADLLLGCLECIQVYEDALSSGEKIPLPAEMVGYKASSSAQYLSKILSKIRPSELGEVLLLLPLHLAKYLLTLLATMLSSPIVCETALRTMMLLLKVHYKPFTSDSSILPILEKLENIAFSTLNRYRDTVGTNLYGLMYIQRDIEEKQGVQLFLDATVARKEKDRKKRRRERATQAVILSM